MSLRHRLQRRPPKKMRKWRKCYKKRNSEFSSMKVRFSPQAKEFPALPVPFMIILLWCSYLPPVIQFVCLGIAGQAGKKKSQNKLDAEKLGLLEQNKEVADMLDELSSDRSGICNHYCYPLHCILLLLIALQDLKSALIVWPTSRNLFKAALCVSQL